MPTKKASKKRVAQLVVRAIKVRAYAEEVLAEVVHDDCSALASNVNYGGLESQIDFLLKQGYSLREVEEKLGFESV